MDKNKIKLEIFEGDPFGSVCCGPGPRIGSSEAERLRRMLMERSQIVERLSQEFGSEVHIRREIISEKVNV
ncbi:MAG: hypothetical protein QXN63_03960 [Candidatus Bathyarchaeia archaeon]